MKFHLIGIGGAGMSVVADLLLSEGHQVSGSDRAESANVNRLRERGVEIFMGHGAENVSQDAVVVISSAIKESNPELAQARNRGQRVLHRSQALALAAGERDFIAVAGAHGKTSTSGMLAVAFAALGRDPSRAIGGSLAGGASGGYLGAGPMLIAEADESDGSFLNYTPRVALVTNVEPDHLDHYGSQEAFEQAFVDFAHCMTPGGLLIACADNDGSRALAQQVAGELRVWTYGHTACDAGERHIGLVEPPGQKPAVLLDGVAYQLDLAVPGAHNLLNAAGAFAVGVELGEDPAAMTQALGEFRGTGRRFETRGEVAGIRVVDDYAHHPTEVAATLSTARTVTSGRVRVLFQPHLYSRTKNFADRFAQALQLADDVIVTAVYAAREEPADGVEGDAITALMPDALYVPELTVAARMIAGRAEPGDLILTMGAGDVTTAASVIIAELEASERNK